MRIVAMSDIHSNFSAFDPAKMPDADACLIAGDITEYGHKRVHEHDRELADAKDWLASLGERFPTYVIPGNHDIRVTNADFEGILNVHPILDRRARVGDCSVYGVSLCPCYFFPRMATMFDYMTVDRFEEQAVYGFDPVDIVLSHCPPYGVLDRLSPKEMVVGQGPNIGSEELLRYIERNAPKLVICGHVHGDAGDMMVGGTRVVNVAKMWKVVEV